MTVRARIESVGDLFAADAVYHRDCLSRFKRKLPRTPHKLKRGRPWRVSVLHYLILLDQKDQHMNNHVEVGISRMRRDFQDRCKLKNYLQLYSPFRFAKADKLITLSSGVIASSEDIVNCDRADEIGFEAQQRWDNAYYGDVSFKKAIQVKNM